MNALFNKISSSFFSIAGRNKQNEDSYEVQTLSDGTLIGVIADGVGGNNGGSVASVVAVQSIMRSLTENPSASFSSIFNAAAVALRATSSHDLLTTNMATTASVCVVHRTGLCRIGHVGDSRIYHLRARGVVQKTKDQTEVAALIEAGILNKEQAKTYPRRTVLRSALSVKGTYEIFEDSFDLNLGDRLVLLTDGVYRLISKSGIRDISLKQRNAEKFVEAILRQIDGKNDDDATLVALDIKEVE